MNPESMQKKLSMNCGFTRMQDLHTPDWSALTWELAVPFGVENPNPFKRPTLLLQTTQESPKPRQHCYWLREENNFFGGRTG